MIAAVLNDSYSQFLTHYVFSVVVFIFKKITSPFFFHRCTYLKLKQIQILLNDFVDFIHI